ncbi:hypothetical protein [Asticcacaulis sp.]|uniref:hypothetical protein n=1 Tax=Asticcacaulis sp. TaxID=1872648 RepID=UPI002CE4F558|nr:hypothetical protein [Asticcacaulis sp.]HTM82776.1 hypothetical protein [Asticcacaulis sp.]
MEFEELLELARDSYVGQFADFVDKQAALFDKGAAEVKLQISGDSEYYRNYFCADFASNDDDGHIVELAAEEEVTFDPVEVSLGNMEITINRLVWNDITIASNDRTLLAGDFAEWFETWFDPEETTFDPDTRFSACIHSLKVDSTQVTVDFGTAPITALADLLMRFESLGCQSLTVN